MSVPQRFIDLLKTELEASFGTLDLPYTVQAREPVESEVGEGSGGPGERQIFISTGNLGFPEGIADQGSGTMLEVPVLVSTVMSFPQSEAATAAVLRRRLTVIQAIQRAVEGFAQEPDTTLEVIAQDDEEPQMIDGYYVSVVGVLLRFYLNSREEL